MSARVARPTLYPPSQHLPTSTLATNLVSSSSFNCRRHTTKPPVKKEREEKKPYSRPDKPARKEWTEEEEVVWREILEKTIRKHLLQAVREDGRLEARKNSIKSHMNALIGSMKRNGIL